MRLGIFSDVHANYEALSAVLESYGEERIDVYYCLGDTVGYGGSPNECADMVRELAKVTILGNHDAAVSGRMDYSYYYEAARHALDVHAAMISAENMSWLKGLPYQHKLEEENVLLCHGSPGDEDEYVTSSYEASFQYRYMPGEVCFFGHTHLQGSFAMRPGRGMRQAKTRSSQARVEEQCASRS